MSKRYAAFVAALAFTTVFGLVWTAESQHGSPHFPEAELLRLQLKVELHMLLDEYGQDHPEGQGDEKAAELGGKGP